MSGKKGFTGLNDKKRDWSINREAVKALVAVYGPREAARQAKIPYGTMCTWCRKFSWKKAERLVHMTGKNGDPSVPMKDDAGDALIRALQNHKEISTLNLAHYTAKAAVQAAKLKDPLEKARNVRDVAAVYQAVWPEMESGELIEAAILVGGMVVKDDPKEILEAARDPHHTSNIEHHTLEDVREELPNQRPESD